MNIRLLFFLYNLSVRLMTSGIRIAATFHPKAKMWTEGRKRSLENLRKVRLPEQNWIWFHCASLGEYEDCCEVFHKVVAGLPHHKTLMTFSSPSGYEAMKQAHTFNYLMYLPVDKKTNCCNFLDVLQPQLVLFGRSELWLNYLNEIHFRRIPLFLIGLKMTHTSGFLRWPATALYRRGFQCFTHIFCQDHTTARLLKTKSGISHTSVTGNPRFDRIYKATLSNKTFPEIERFASGGYTVIAGSYLKKDLRIIRSVIPDLIASDCRIILVPHEIRRSAISKLLDVFPEKAITYSDRAALNSKHRILIIDHVGSLKYLYRYADLALIGGGFNRIGIHNIIEPAAHGLITLFGPNHRNYTEAIDLLKHKAAFVYRNKDELATIIQQQRQVPCSSEKRHSIRKYVLENVPDCADMTKEILLKITQSY